MAPEWDADGVLVRSAAPGLTGDPIGGMRLRVFGKTETSRERELGMTTRQSQTRTRPAPCRSPGPPLDVVEWRLCRLREAGFPPVLASVLARQRVDLHALLELVDAGCPPELAARILAPLDHLPRLGGNGRSGSRVR